MRSLFLLAFSALILAIAALGYFHHGALWAYVVILPVFLLGVYDTLQQRHTLLRNFPVLGYFRYMFEFIAPELQQYFIERSTDGKPFTAATTRTGLPPLEERG